MNIRLNPAILLWVVLAACAPRATEVSAVQRGDEAFKNRPKRCGSESEAAHDWADVERARPCFHLKRCTRCEKEAETPDHNWEAKPGVVEDIQLTCSRCGLSI